MGTSFWVCDGAFRLKITSNHRRIFFFNCFLQYCEKMWYCYKPVYLLNQESSIFDDYDSVLNVLSHGDTPQPFCYFTSSQRISQRRGLAVYFKKLLFLKVWNFNPTSRRTRWIAATNTLSKLTSWQRCLLCLLLCNYGSKCNRLCKE